MIMKDRMEVVSHKEIARSIYELTLRGKLVGEVTSPGQFIHIRVTDSMDPLLRRPISIAKLDKENDEITILYRADGHGTNLLAKRQVGETIDVLGPLGNGFPLDDIEAGETAYLIGGGIGVPPLYELSRQLTAKGVHCVHVLGFESEDVVFYEEEFRALGDTHIATVDGTRGTKGFVTHVMEELSTDFKQYYSCGPMPMLKAIQAAYPDKEGYLSFEERMGCGMGACFACVCETKDRSKGDYVKICSDGPVFKAGVVSL